MVYTEKMRQAQERYRNKHRKELQERARRKYRENIDKIKERKRLWRKGKKRRAYERKWQKENRERINKLARESYERNSEHYRKKKHDWVNKNRKKSAIIQKNWRKRNPFYTLNRHAERYRAMQIISGRRIPICEKCKESQYIVLVIHHKDGIKNKSHREERLHIYRKILSGERKIDDLQVLCCNCNKLIEIERGNIKFDEKLFEKILKKKKMIHQSDSFK